MAIAEHTFGAHLSLTDRETLEERTEEYAQELLALEPRQLSAYRREAPVLPEAFTPLPGDLPLEEQAVLAERLGRDIKRELATLALFEAVLEHLDRSSASPEERSAHPRIAAAFEERKGYYFTALAIQAHVKAWLRVRAKRAAEAEASPRSYRAEL